MTVADSVAEGFRDAAMLEKPAVTVRGSTSSRDMSSYVSRLLADRLATGGPIPAFESRTVRAALLLTDIVGFTAHVERVSAARPTGLEDLARDFDAYFSDLVALVYGYGGDVLAIAGDAFFSYWPAATDHELADAVMRAMEAGRAVQAGLAHRGRAPVHRFETRAGVSAGALRVGFVGGVADRWELMPAGDALDDVARAERTATPGTVAIAAPAWRLVADRCEGRPLEDGLLELTDVLRPAGPVPAPALTTPDPPDGLIAPFVPLPVRRGPVTAGSEWMQEKRRVTVVMASLATDDAHDAGLELRHAGVRAFQRVMARFEGAAKLLIDDKGVSLSGAFGLPPRAHADDARRAVHAAEALRRELDAIGLPCTIGVASGRAFCGIFGSDLRREYTLHGEVVNLAARLMQVSRGEIICADTTVREARDGVTFDALDPVSVKGHAEPVLVHRAAGPRPARDGRDARMVGREGERALIERGIDDLVTEGRSATVIIEGEAGMGKSRLVAEAVHIARARGVRVLTAAADAVESATSYYAWRAAFTELLNVTPGTTTLSDVPCDPALRRMLPLLGGIVPVAIPDNDITEGMVGNVRAENTKVLLASILRQTTATASALIVVEDAHWLDSNSWALLLEIVRSVPRVVVAVTVRPMTNPPEQLRRLRSMRSTKVVVLNGLSSEEIQTLVEHRLGLDELPPELTTFVDDRVAGHPFFCEELVQTMREGGIVRVENGVAVVGDLESLDVPATIEGAVLSRVDRLTAGQLLCLKVGAVIGRSFLTRTVSDTLPLREERQAVPAHLEMLATLDLTVREIAESDVAYLFRHQITRDVAYELLTMKQRRHLHRAVAEWHERTYSEADLAPHFALLAHHWARAEDADKAVSYLVRAGQQALRSGAFREALLFLTDAISVEGAAEDPVREALCLKGLGTTHYFLGDFTRSRACLVQALARLDRPFPSSAVGTARGLAAAAATQVAHLARPSRYRGRRHDDKDKIAEALECYKILGQIGYLDGEPTANVLYGTLAGLNLGEEAGPSPHLARMLIHAAAACRIVGLGAQADRYAQRAIRMVDTGAHRDASAYVWNIWAVINAHRGDWTTAEDANRTALERLGEIGDFNLEAEVWQTRAAIYICSGRFDDAEAAWTRHRVLAERKGNAQNKCWSLLDEAEARIGRDEVAAAAVALEAALAIPTAPNDGSSTIEKHYATAIVRAAQGRFDEAVDAADAVVDIIAGRPPTAFHYVDFCAGAVRVYFDALEYGDGDRSSTLGKAERGCRLLRRLSWQFDNVRARRWLLQGLLEWERGDPLRARKAWRRAETTALTLDVPYERAGARYEIARHAPPSAERDAYLADAAATFEALGARRNLRRVREAQETGPVEVT